MNPADDAAVFRLPSGEGIVVTADFFTPIVDDPRDFGAIAAANALSDVYAMGARPLLALNLVAFPLESLGAAVLGEILAGGAEIIHEAGAVVGGGHSIDDREPKYGLAVVGLVDPLSAWTKGALTPGDHLFLTKPLGTGMIATAHKRDGVAAEILAAAVRSMRRLNRDAMDAGRAAGVRAATDVTGFGLLGHLLEMLRASRLSAQLDFSALPFLEGARDCAERGFVAGGTRRNLEDVASAVTFAATLSDVDRLLCADAQTSGGLLLAVAPERSSALTGELERRGVLAARIGHVTDAVGQNEAPRIRVS
jgi:selenide,water dikinase